MVVSSWFHDRERCMVCSLFLFVKFQNLTLPLCLFVVIVFVYTQHSFAAHALFPKINSHPTSSAINIADDVVLRCDVTPSHATVTLRYDDVIIANNTVTSDSRFRLQPLNDNRLLVTMLQRTPADVMRSRRSQHVCLSSLLILSHVKCPQLCIACLAFNFRHFLSMHYIPVFSFFP